MKISGKKKKKKKKKKEKWDKAENHFSVCSDWDADIKEQDKKNQELEDKKNNDRKTPKQALNLHQWIPLVLIPPNPPSNS